MAIFKKALILGTAIALLPTDKAQQTEFYKRSTDALQWTMTFCDRNQAICTEGNALWATFVQKAEFGAGVAYTLFQKQFNIDEPRALPVKEPLFERRGTLKPEDMQPGWRGGAQTSRSGA